MNRMSITIAMLFPLWSLGCIPEADLDEEAEELDVAEEELKHNQCKTANLGNGDYCSISLNPNATGQNLYTCVDKKKIKSVKCSNGCQVMPPGVDDVCYADPSDAVDRARAWVDAGMPYCGGVNNGTDYICGGICDRPASAEKPEWNAYRSDCSGLVSYAWGLSTYGGGRRTWEFAPFDTSVSYTINAHDLQPGDALNSLYDDIYSQHIILFAGWVDKASGLMRVIEEANCDQTARDHQIYVQLQGGEQMWIEGYGPYAAIRAY